MRCPPSQLSGRTLSSSMEQEGRGGRGGPPSGGDLCPIFKIRLDSSRSFPSDLPLLQPRNQEGSRDRRAELSPCLGFSFFISCSEGHL